MDSSLKKELKLSFQKSVQTSEKQGQAEYEFTFHQMSAEPKISPLGIKWQMQNEHLFLTQPSFCQSVRQTFQQIAFFTQSNSAVNTVPILLFLLCALISYCISKCNFPLLFAGNKQFLSSEVCAVVCAEIDWVHWTNQTVPQTLTWELLNGMTHRQAPAWPVGYPADQWDGRQPGVLNNLFVLCHWQYWIVIFHQNISTISTNWGLVVVVVFLPTCCLTDNERHFVWTGTGLVYRCIG